ncbi:MAG: DUF3604 domain-containing protein [Candidatus Hodarchaeales archaeon]
MKLDELNWIWLYKLLLKLFSIIIYFIGSFTIIFYFFNVIGLIIGILFFFGFKDVVWKCYGLVLAIAASVSAFIAQIGNQSLMEPIYLAMITGWGILALYFLFFMIWKFWLSKYEYSKSWISKIQKSYKDLPKWAAVSILLVLVAIPATLWLTVNINFDVMLDNRPRLLWVNAPSTFGVDTDFNFTVEAWDSYERLSAIYKGTVEFSTVSYDITTLNPLPSIEVDLPAKYTFTGQNSGSDMAYAIMDSLDNGLHVFQMSISTPGIHYILVEDSVTWNTYYSNPILIRDMVASDTNIYWGDIHAHSYLSDGGGTAEHSFYYARNVACLDVYALTDHGEILMNIPGGFDMLERAANLAYDQHSFVTFQGIEWTNHQTGHFTCIFNEDHLIKKPILSFVTVADPDELWKVLDNYTDVTGCRVLALPHHTVKRTYSQDWSYYNPKYIKIAEVSSVHGDSLFAPNHPLSYRGSTLPAHVSGSSIVDALRMGLQLSLYASSDSHDGHPGHDISHTPAFIGHQRPWSTWYTRNDKPYPSGLTAIHARNLTREAIFTSLENRQIFANSDHGRPILTFKINGTEVGGNSTLKISDTGVAKEIEVFLAQDGSPAAYKNTVVSVTPDWTPNWKAVVEIIKNGEILAKIPVDNPVSHVSYIDTSPVTGTSYGEEECFKQGESYYLNRYSDNPVDPNILNTDGSDFYLIRVVGENGRTSYIGPIWVKYSN